MLLCWPLSVTKSARSVHTCCCSFNLIIISKVIIGKLSFGKTIKQNICVINTSVGTTSNITWYTRPEYIQIKFMRESWLHENDEAIFARRLSIRFLVIPPREFYSARKWAALINRFTTYMEYHLALMISSGDMDIGHHWPNMIRRTHGNWWNCGCQDNWLRTLIGNCVRSQLSWSQFSGVNCPGINCPE